MAARWPVPATVFAGGVGVVVTPGVVLGGVVAGVVEVCLVDVWLVAGVLEVGDDAVEGVGGVVTGGFTGRVVGAGLFGGAAADVGFTTSFEVATGEVGGRVPVLAVVAGRPGVVGRAGGLVGVLTVVEDVLVAGVADWGVNAACGRPGVLTTR